MPAGTVIGGPGAARLCAGARISGFQSVNCTVTHHHPWDTQKRERTEDGIFIVNKTLLAIFMTFYDVTLKAKSF